MSYSEDDNLCMFATLVYHRHPNEKLGIKDVKAEANQYWMDFEKIKCNKKTLKDALEKYKGFSFEDHNVYRFCHHFKINVSFFNYENDHYFLSQEYSPPMLYCGADGKPKHYEDTLNILLVNHNDKFHAMYIKNVENLTGLRFCNICKTSIKRDAAHGDRTFKNHMRKHELINRSKEIIPHGREMTLSDQPEEKLREVVSLIYGDSTDEFMKGSKEDVIRDFKGDLQVAGYTGDDNFDHIFSFLKQH
jgi:hypothetical protein